VTGGGGVTGGGVVPAAGTAKLAVPLEVKLADAPATAVPL